MEGGGTGGNTVQLKCPMNPSKTIEIHRREERGGTMKEQRVAGRQKVEV